MTSFSLSFGLAPDCLYTTVDENLKTLSQDPYSIVAIANRDQRQSGAKPNDKENDVMDVPNHDKS